MQLALELERSSAIPTRPVLVLMDVPGKLLSVVDDLQIEALSVSGKD